LIVTDLRRSAVEAALKVNKTAGAQSALRTIESGELDYSRLTYESQAVKSALILAGDDPYRAAKMFDAVKASKDTYKIKAWIDQAPALIPVKPADAQGWEEFKADISQSVELTRSASASRYEQERHIYLDELAEISRTTSMVADDLISDGMMSYGKSSVMARVFEGITLDRETNELKTDFGKTYDEMPEYTYQRLETERAEREKVQGEFFKKCGTEYDPLMDGA
jgi:hypothetical protein